MVFVVRMSRGAAGPADKEPTFQEFIHFLLNTEIYSDDEHWQPIALRCRSAQPIGGVRLLYAGQICVVKFCQCCLSRGPAGKDQEFNNFYKLEHKIWYELILKYSAKPLLIDIIQV